MKIDSAELRGELGRAISTIGAALAVVQKLDGKIAKAQLCQEPEEPLTLGVLELMIELREGVATQKTTLQALKELREWRLKYP